MTKKHFEAFAREIREDETLNQTRRYDVADIVARVAKRFNPRFDRDRFLKACGID